MTIDVVALAKQCGSLYERWDSPQYRAELQAFADAVLEEAAARIKQLADDVREEGVTSIQLGFMVQDYEECKRLVRSMKGQK